MKFGFSRSIFGILEEGISTCRNDEKTEMHCQNLTRKLCYVLETLCMLSAEPAWQNRFNWQEAPDKEARTAI